MPPFAYRVRPKCCPLAAGDLANSNARKGVFKRKPTPGLIRGGLAPGKRVKQKMEPRFDSIETEEALGVIQQVEIRQQVHREIAAERSVAVAAVATDSSHLDRALIELDVVGLVSLGC